MAEQKSFLTLKQTSERYAAFPIGSLRWIIANKEQNGFTSVMCKVGKRIVIDEDAFVAWIRHGGCSIKNEKN
jgi:hypothetical protein